ncbi:MAG: ATP-dependent Clp protease ATP-binding subunit [Victivallales bacterium]|nr:ATP-dependent Clp protease ATP-binding subunit [Victivallales bacterium]
MKKPLLHQWLATLEGKKFASICSEYILAFRSPCIMPEHILLTLLEDENALEPFATCMPVIDDISYRTRDYLSQLPLARHICDEMTGEFAQRFWDRIRAIGEEAGLQNPTSDMFYYVLLQEDDSFAQEILRHYGFVLEDLHSAIVKGVPYHLADLNAPAPKKDGEAAQNGVPEELASLLIELVQVAKDGKMDPLIGRRKEVEELMQTLNRKKKSAPVLLGAPGVGKTAVVEGLAWLVSRGEVPPTMANLRIYALQTGALVAGASLLGEFEQRMQNLLKFIESSPDNVLFLDELQGFMGIGPNGPRSESGSATNLIKPEIASGRLRVIAATTDDDYRKTIALDKAFARRFHPIHILAPSQDETLEILLGLEDAYFQYHGVHFPEPLLKRIISLTERYIPQRFLPDKAIDIMDVVGAKYRLHRNDSQANQAPVATDADVEEAVSKAANLPSIPSAQGENDDFAGLANLEERLKAVVFGQENAIREVARAIRIAKCGLLSERAGTIGNFFFSGPSGVGKTELARQLASVLEVKLIRFDMSEYSTEQMVTRFVGSAPGLVGYDEGGQLTNAVRDCPHCVLLLDEVEKAHYLVHSLLLQVMDNGTLTDSRGIQTDFHNVILIMTGNVGCTEASAKSSRLGFGTSPNAPVDPDIIAAQFRRAFSPEFRARLTAHVIFSPLGLPEVEHIVEAKFARLAKLAKSRNFHITMSPEARTDIAQRAMAQNQGARPVDRILEQEVTSVLAQLMVDGKSRRTLTVVLQDGKVVLQQG